MGLAVMCDYVYNYLIVLS